MVDQPVPRLVAAHAGDRENVRPEGEQVVYSVACAAWAEALLLVLDDDNGRFPRQLMGLTVNIDVCDHVADDADAPVPEPVYQFRPDFHARTSSTLLKTCSGLMPFRHSWSRPQRLSLHGLHATSFDIACVKRLTYDV